MNLFQKMKETLFQGNNVNNVNNEY